MLIFSLTQGIISKMVFKILNWIFPNHSNNRLEIPYKKKQALRQAQKKPALFVWYWKSVIIPPTP